MLEYGQLFSWGKGKSGQLGHGNTENVCKPTLVSSLQSSRIVHVCCGWDHSLCVSEAGTILSWGCGAHGRLGCAAESDQLLPVSVLLPFRVLMVSAGLCHNLALTGLLLIIGSHRRNLREI